MPTRSPRLVAVPGLGLDAVSWQATLHGIAAVDPDFGDAQVVLLPGLGEPVGKRPVSPAELAHELLRRCPMAPLVLLGHSASCQVVAQAACLAPERVRALVLVGPSTDPRARSWPRLAARLLADLPAESLLIVPSQLRQYFSTGLPSMVRLMEVARRDRLDTTLAGARCPVLVVRGPSDRIVPEDWVEALAREAVSGGDEPPRLVRVTTMHHGAHMVTRTVPREVGRVIAHFLADVRLLGDDGA